MLRCAALDSSRQGQQRSSRITNRLSWVKLLARTLATIADPDAREFARDFFIDQFFRRDIFIRQGRKLEANERRAQLLATCFALTSPVNAIEYKMQTPAGQLRYDNAVARNIVAALAGGPRLLVDICTELDLSPQDVLANALVLSAGGALRPVERSRTAVQNLNEAICRRLGGPEEIPLFCLAVRHRSAN